MQTSSASRAPMPAQTFTLPVVVALATVYLVWGSTYFGIRVVLESFPAFLGAGFRFLVAGSILFAFLALRGRPMPTRREWRDGAIVGVLLLVGGNGGVVYAEQYVSSSVAAVFIGGAPLLAALWSGLFGKWPQRLQWVGIVIGFCGILLLVSGSTLSGQPIGLVGLLIAELCWTLGSVLAQTKLAPAPGAMGFATEMLTGGVVMLAIAFARGEWPLFVAQGPPSTTGWIAMTYLVFAGSIAAFSAYMYLLSKVSSTIAISYAYVNPLIAVVIGTMLAGEVLTLRESIATAVIVGSVILLTREKPRA